MPLRAPVPGTRYSFLGYLATMMIPSDVLMIPQFVLMKKIPEWLNVAFGTEAFDGFVYFRHHYVGRPVGLDSFFALIAPGLLQRLWHLHAQTISVGNLARN